MPTYRVYESFDTGTRTITGSSVKLIDTASPFVKMVARDFPKSIQRGLKSTGWWMQQEIKAGIRSGAPGGQRYEAFSKIKNLSNTYDTIKLNRLSKKTGKQKFVRSRHIINEMVREKGRHSPLGRLVNAVGYQYYTDGQRVIVGWLSASAIDIGTKLEQGFTTSVTPKMRKMFIASGLKLGKSVIKTPKRETYGPIYQAKQAAAGQYFESKLYQYIQGGGKT